MQTPAHVVSVSFSVCLTRSPSHKQQEVKHGGNKKDDLQPDVQLLWVLLSVHMEQLVILSQQLDHTVQIQDVTMRRDSVTHFLTLQVNLHSFDLKTRLHVGAPSSQGRKHRPRKSSNFLMQVRRFEVTAILTLPKQITNECVRSSKLKVTARSFHTNASRSESVGQSCVETRRHRLTSGAKQAVLFITSDTAASERQRDLLVSVNKACQRYKSFTSKRKLREKAAAHFLFAITLKIGFEMWKKSLPLLLLVSFSELNLIELISEENEEFWDAASVHILMCSVKSNKRTTLCDIFCRKCTRSYSEQQKPQDIKPQRLFVSGSEVTSGVGESSLWWSHQEEKKSSSRRNRLGSLQQLKLKKKKKKKKKKKETPCWLSGGSAQRSYV
ncbi:uncharacterized protein V6R79_002426 [Siganus canaliculatus]